METYLIAHMPKQEHAGRLAQKGTGLPGQTPIPASTANEALKRFYERHPDRTHTAMGIEGKEEI